MRLVLTDLKGQTRVIPVTQEEIVCGRLPTNQVVLDGTFVSRQHTKFSLRGHKLFVQDLGSRNGTFVNGQKVRERQLDDGDEVSVGNNIFRVEERAAEEVVFADDDQEILSGEGVIIKALDESVQMGSAETISEILTKGTQAAVDKDLGIRELDPAELRRLRINEQNLRIVHEMAGQLTATVDLDELLQRVLNLVMEVIPADKGYLLLLDEQSGNLVPMVVKLAGSEAGTYEGEELQISRTVVNTVIKQRAAVRTSNAGEEFADAASIVSFGISSVLAVPLWKGNQVIGVIYLDSAVGVNPVTGETEEVFPEYALDLLTTIGHQAALFITQARLVDKFRREQEMRANFERFLSPQVAAQMVETGMTAELVASEQMATILFSDICSFTSWSERLGAPQKIADRLNEYFGLMTDVIFEHQGTLDKFIGDGLMALFGVPTATGDDVTQAVRAGARMIEEVEKLMAEKPEEEKFRIRVGINSGRVVAGMMGSVKRPEYSVLGDAVNTASRIESLAEANSVYVGAQTYELVKDQFNFTDMGFHSVKGKAEKIQVYRLER